MIVKIFDRVVTEIVSIKIENNYDSMASLFELRAYFNPDSKKHKELYKPMKYKPITISEGNFRLLTGTILNHKFSSDSKTHPMTITGYSQTGVFEDCKADPGLPLQFDGLTLFEIVKKIVNYYNLEVVSPSDPEVLARINLPFSEITQDSDITLKEYMSKLASERGVYISHDRLGRVTFSRLNIKKSRVAYRYDISERVLPKLKEINELPGDPIEEISKGKISMELGVDGQQQHEFIHMRGQQSVEGGDNGVEGEISNPLVSIFRRTTVTQESGDENDLTYALQNELGKEIKNIELTIKLNRFTWNYGGLEDDLIVPNTMITVRNPEIYLYNTTLFFVRSVIFTEDAKGKTATVHCVLPGSFAGTDITNPFE